MVIQMVSQPSGLDADVVHICGEPEDVSTLMRRSDVEDVLIAGYIVGHAAPAKHDGEPAKRFTLEVDSGHEVGRLVVRTGLATEYTFEFDTVFVDGDAAWRFVESVHNPPVTSKVVQSTQDFAYEEASLEEALAELSATFGVSVTVVDPSGSGGGWPTVKIVGLTANVRNALKTAWQWDEADLDTMITEVRS